jgi:beta-fructofuranosidase
VSMLHLPLSRRGLLGGLGLAAWRWPISDARAEEEGDRARRLAADPLRPQYHLLPKANWMNDPNGPVYADGSYHLFYQYSADALGKSPKQWGHAVSADMLHWRHWPMALSPTPGGWDYYGIWSGCAVIDGNIPTLIYTAVGRKPQMQALATSDDGLRSWQKRPEPIIDGPPPGIDAVGFRDPVVWREQQGEWSMIIGSGDKRKGPMVLLYRSPDLQRWRYVGPLYEEEVTPFAGASGVADGMMWECPDFFSLGGKHVLLTSGRGTRWAIGTYDGSRFQPERFGVLDHGYSYAPRTMEDAAGNRILWAWLKEARPEKAVLEAGWSGVMSLPRQLEIAPDGELSTRLPTAVDSLRREHRVARQNEISDALKSWHIDGLCGEIRVVARNSFRLRLETPAGDTYTEAGYDVDRDMAMAGPFRPPLRLGLDHAITMRLLIDGSVCEIYVNDRICVSLRSYPRQTGPLMMTLDNPTVIESVESWRYAPISPDRLTS